MYKSINQQGDDGITECFEPMTVHMYIQRIDILCVH